MLDVVGMEPALLWKGIGLALGLGIPLHLCIATDIKKLGYRDKSQRCGIVDHTKETGYNGGSKCNHCSYTCTIPCKHALHPLSRPSMKTRCKTMCKRHTILQ
jgi:hypothetical protein